MRVRILFAASKKQTKWMIILFILKLPNFFFNCWSPLPSGVAKKRRKWDGYASVLLYFPLFPGVQKVENGTKKIVTQGKNKSEETGGRRPENPLPSLFSFFLGRSLSLSDLHTQQFPSHSSPVSGEALFLYLQRKIRTKVMVRTLSQFLDKNE